MPSLLINDFSGGLNLRDNPAELELNETPSALNWTIDTRGAIRVRNGCLNVVALPGVSGKAAYIFYSAALDQWLCVRETAGAPNTLHLHTRPADFSGVWTDRGAVNSVLTAKVGFCDFPGATPKVVIATDANSGGTKGIWTWDGTTLTNVSATVAGYAVALWQNRAWVCGYPTSDANGNPTRLFACAAGDPATWATGSGGLTVDVRDVDALKLTALGVVGGSLHVFKGRSAYRVNDSSTGAYATIDSTAGCAGPLAIVSDYGRLFTWGRDSLYEWDGIGAGRKVGDKCRPLFATDAAVLSQTSAGAATSDSPLCGGLVEDRVLYAYPSAVSGANDRLLEYDPAHGWLMKHRLASSETVSSFARKGSDLFAAVMSGDVIYKVFSETPGSDNAVLYANSTCIYSTPWLQPIGGKRCRVRRALITGLLGNGATNVLNFRVGSGFGPGLPSPFDLSTDLRGALGQAIATSTLRSLGQDVAFQFSFTDETANGSASVFALELDIDQLER